MNSDADKKMTVARAQAFYLVQTLSKRLEQAIANGQDFQSVLSGPVVECGVTSGHIQWKPDGSYRMLVSIAAPGKSCDGDLERHALQPSAKHLRADRPCTASAAESD